MDGRQHLSVSNSSCLLNRRVALRRKRLADEVRHRSVPGKVPVLKYRPSKLLKLLRAAADPFIRD